jgi:soluble lytic murein transglycosylase
MYVVGKSGLVVTALFAALAVSGASAVHAWDGPLCALDESLSEPTFVRVEVEPSPEMCAPDLPPIPAIAEAGSTIGDDVARRALARARELHALGRHGEALLQLGVVDAAFPSIADRTALLRADLHLAAGEPREAKAAYEIARESIDSTVATLARLGRVRAMIAMGHRDAASELTQLLRRYPELPDELALRFELALSAERAGNVNGAVRSYRAIDLEHPGSPVAARARERLDAIRANGTVVRDLPLLSQVERADRLVRQGPMTMARDEVERLLGLTLAPDLRARVAASAARLARVEGRWEDARRFALMAQGATFSSEEDRVESAEQVQDLARAATAREVEAARSAIARLKGRGPWSRVPALRLRNIVEIAARAGLRDETNAAVEALAAQRNLHPQVAWDAGILASGVADPAHLEQLFGRLVTNPRYATEARYHRARALERLGRWVDAEVELLAVSEIDRSETRWYAMLAEQRLWFVREAMLCRCGPEEMRQAAVAALEPTPSDAGAAFASLAALVDTDSTATPEAHREGTVRATRRPIRPPREPDLAALARELEPLVERHGEAYPWLARARDLLRLGEKEAATDELHEAYLAWRDARGVGLRRVGLEAVYRGAEAPRRFVDFRTKRARRELRGEDQRLLVEITASLGDEGSATGFAGWGRIASRPRAYEATVEEVARRHGLDPNLLLAVMRVESTYQKRIISYAGAVGLMQIMPRTGRLIAGAIGKDDYTTADLLDPETNLDFAAWYLASLIERFDGRLPLAIASYNGGPHNVRRWMRDHAEDMPLDAFVERIPFEQTHRYVRRVLTHYAAYRAQENLPMERLSLELPSLEPDPIGF